ncbi:glycosyltransferase family 2 protein [Granulicella sp. dw_53]|uniref:glycosyltransferase family 2 protein n=1 Tax=Granulicella sp. dw_53 TaxID=2719792 RepID=UPI001BD47590|nr:glycosyltransferase family 2 protein [Granulicella sp. dw_53]
MKPTVIILTYNSSGSISNTLASIGPLTDDIHVVDSGSTDGTLDIASQFGAKICHHNFLNYGDQRNWAIENLSIKYQWQLHLDADEQLTAALRDEILNLSEDPSEDGFFIQRYLRFMNRTLKHNLAPTWHMRLFRSGRGRCEDREYDQHFYCLGATAQLGGSMIDDIRMSLSEWTSRHNRWSDAEVREIQARISVGRIESKLTGDVVQRRRYLRGFYDQSPMFLRAFGLFIYRYIIRFGFLDGKEGLIFCVLQTLWFRFLVDAKLFEIETQSIASPTQPK